MNEAHDMPSWGAGILCILFALAVGVALLVLIIVAATRRSRPAPKGARTVIHSCPTRAQWRDWLDNRLPARERTDFAVHLEGCLQCQRLLDDLAGADRRWSDMAQEAFTAAPPEPEFARALHELRDRPPAATTDSSLPFLQPSDEPGHLGKLDGYEILSEVGRGGMGVVLKAFDPKLQRLVAVKVLAPQLAASGPARQRFLREARAAAAVVHEHVVTIHAVEETGGTPYLVMQFVGGRSLQDRLDKSGPLEVKEILRIGMQAASGLAAAHKQGMVHRDVKPANILLENGVERVKLADFGLARTMDDASLTHSGVVTGSPLFMSPEQARGEVVDARADLFGLGCVLYAMAAGHPPFRAPTALAVLKRVCDDDPRPLTEINPEIPDWLEAIIFKLLEKHPADRFQSAAEVADLLGQHLRYLQEPDAPEPPQVNIPASAVVHAGEAKGPVAWTKHSNRTVWIVLACVLLLFVVCAGVPLFLLASFFAVEGPAPQNAAVQHSVGPAIASRDAPAMEDQTVPNLADRLDDAAFRKVDGFDYLGADFSQLPTITFRFRAKYPLGEKPAAAAGARLRDGFLIALATVNRTDNAAGPVLGSKKKWYSPQIQWSQRDPDFRERLNLIIVPEVQNLNGGRSADIVSIVVEQMPGFKVSPSQKLPLNDTAFQRDPDFTYLSADDSQWPNVVFRLRSRKPATEKDLDTRLRDRYQVKLTYLPGGKLGPLDSLRQVSRDLTPEVRSSVRQPDGRILVELAVSLL
ncbi:MAG: protein kinase domain-containing protein, partial [Gemmataceae bacterium]